MKMKMYSLKQEVCLFVGVWLSTSVSVLMDFCYEINEKFCTYVRSAQVARHQFSNYKI